LCLALVAVVATAAWLRLATDARHAETAEPTGATQPPVTGSAASRRDSRPALLPGTPPAAPAAGRSPLGSQPFAVVQPEEIGLQIDAGGQLVKNAQTRDELERILAGDPDGLEIRRQEILDRLPPAAAREALDLLDRFSNYRQALQQALPDTSLVLTEQDALVMLDTAHALRVTYFGPEVTEALFGEEEAIGRGTAEGILNAGSDAR